MNMLNKIDGTILKGVSAGVKAWNWTTGKTKADLSNRMLAVAPALESIGAINTHPVMGAIFIPIGIWHSYLFQKINNNLEKKEAKALESEAKDYSVEIDKDHYKMQSLLWTPSTYLWAISHQEKGTFISPTDSTDYCFALGNFLRISSFYVMRTDYLPPRKNVVSRAVNKLSEYASYLREGLKAPSPVQVQARMMAGQKNSGLESHF